MTGVSSLTLELFHVGVEPLALPLGPGDVISEHRLAPGRSQRIEQQPQALRCWHPDVAGYAGNFAGFNVLELEIAPVGRDFNPVRLKVLPRRSIRFCQQPPRSWTL